MKFSSHVRNVLPGVAGLAALVVAGCGALGRASLTDEQLEERRIEYGAVVTEDYDRSMGKLVQRIKGEHDDYEAGRSAEPARVDVLILSGGGDYGAFGAGFLQGWGEIAAGPMARPEFDVVTGVSTGALIAPFAFVGDTHAYERVVELYREPKKDWVRLRGLFFFLPDNPSFLDCRGLERDLDREINRDVIARVAEQSRAGKRLAIGATNLDYGITRGFDLSNECEKAVETGDYSRVHEILMASAAIPAAFPPRVIDGHLYVDGGTTANILFNTDLKNPSNFINLWKRSFPGVTTPQIRFWIIVNNQLSGAASVVQPRWGSITGASLSASIRAATLLSLRALSSHVELLKSEGMTTAEMHIVSIPTTWRAPSTEVFNQATMRSLTELGRTMGADAGSWTEDVPQPPMP